MEMMMRLLLSIVFLALVETMNGCSQDPHAGATGGGNPSPITVSLKIEADPQATVLARKMAAASDFELTDSKGVVLHIQEARFHISRIRLESDAISGCPLDKCESGWFLWEGSWVVDLVTQESSPPLPTLEILSGTYSRLELRIDDEAVPLLLPEQTSFDLSLEFNYNGASTVLKIPMRFGVEVEFTNTQGLTLESDQSMRALFAIRHWLAGVDVVGCLESDNTILVSPNVYQVDEGDCGLLNETIKKNIKESGSLME